MKVMMMSENHPITSPCDSDSGTDRTMLRTQVKGNHACQIGGEGAVLTIHQSCDWGGGGTVHVGT